MHSWRETERKQAESFTEYARIRKVDPDAWIFEKDETSRSIDELNNNINYMYNSNERLHFMKTLAEKKTKNRFVF